MKQIFLLSLILFFIVVFAVSCNSEAESTDPEETLVPTELNEESVTDLTSFNEGETKLYRLDGSGSTINLEGATIDSLFAIEKVEDQSKGLSSRAPEEQSAYISYESGGSGSPMIVIPQANGKVELKASELGISADGSFKITRLGNGAKFDVTDNGDNFFWYKMKNTKFNYREEEYDEADWPMYLNYYVVDLNDPDWTKYKDQKVVLFQGIAMYSRNGGSETSDRFGLVSPGSIVYNEDPTIQGLYDLSGKDHVYIYSFLQNPFTDCEDLRFETYFLLANDLEMNDSFTIKDLPVAVVLRNDFTTEKDYVVTLEDVPASFAGNILNNFLCNIAGGGHTRVGENNGIGMESKGYVQKITSTDNCETFDAEVLLRNVSEDFVLKLSTGDRYYENGKPAEYGKISFREANDDDIALFNAHKLDFSSATSGSFELDCTEVFYMNWELPEEDKNEYLLTIQAEGVTGISQRGENMWFNGGSGGDTVNAVLKITHDSVFGITTAFPNGYMTIYKRDNEKTTVTWKLEKIEE